MLCFVCFTDFLARFIRVTHNIDTSSSIFTVISGFTNAVSYIRNSGTIIIMWRFYNETGSNASDIDGEVNRWVILSCLRLCFASSLSCRLSLGGTGRVGLWSLFCQFIIYFRMSPLPFILNLLSLLLSLMCIPCSQPRTLFIGKRSKKERIRLV